MSYPLVLLGLLAEKPRYGYEIKQYFEAGVFNEYVRLTGGGLYYNLHKLLKEGYIEEIEVEREANYPDRHIYQITEAGKEYLVQLVREIFSDTTKRIFFDPIDAALPFSRLLPKAEILARLQRQVDGLHAKLLQLEVLREPLNTPGLKVNPWAVLTLDHNIHRVRSDIEWLETTIKQISTDANLDKSYNPEWREAEKAYEDVDDPKSKLWTQFEASVQKAFHQFANRFRLAWRDYDTRLSLPGVSETILGEAKADFQRRAKAAQNAYQKALEEARNIMGSTDSN